MRALTLLLLAILGVPLTLGGAWLTGLGGSPFYLLSGLAVLIVAWGVWKRQRWAAPLYAAWLVLLLLWSLWEAGLYWWPLATRLGLPVIVGLVMAAPASRRGGQGAIGAFTPGMPVLITSVVAAVVALVGIPRHLHETSGQLAMDIVNPAPKLGDTETPHGDWNAYGGTYHGQRFSPLNQITPQNVNQLDVAWQIRTGDMRGPGDVGETTYQATPLKIKDSLYLCTPHSIAIALDADTGAEKWRFDPQAGLEKNRQHQTCRGVAYYSEAMVQPVAAAAAQLVGAGHFGDPCGAVQEPHLPAFFRRQAVRHGRGNRQAV
jgi:quinoprotein glucose dehydrogenase